MRPLDGNTVYICAGAGLTCWLVALGIMRLLAVEPHGIVQN